jgi:hypothetical protein
MLKEHHPDESGGEEGEEPEDFGEKAHFCGRERLLLQTKGPQRPARSFLNCEHFPGPGAGGTAASPLWKGRILGEVVTKAA